MTEYDLKTPPELIGILSNVLIYVEGMEGLKHISYDVNALKVWIEREKSRIDLMEAEEDVKRLEEVFKRASEIYDKPDSILLDKYVAENIAGDLEDAKNHKEAISGAIGELTEEINSNLSGAPYTLIVDNGKPSEVVLKDKAELIAKLKECKSEASKYAYYDLKLYDRDGRDITEFQWVEELISDITEGSI